MKGIIKTIFVILFAVFISGCSHNKTSNKPLIIVSNAWIGYAPLFYAQQKGYLKEINIKVIPVVSLAEARDTFLVGKADLVTTTQHEYHSIKKRVKDFIPIILLDRSNGGDMVLSNRDIDELKKATRIQAYLEMDSINLDIIQTFLKKYNISKDKVVYHNEDQAEISTIGYKKEPVVIVTYVPYDTILKQKGFLEVASTKDISSLVVVDALCTTRKIAKKYKNRLVRLKEIIDRSIKEITIDKKSSYKLIFPYLDNISLENYVKSFNTIKWINHPNGRLLDIIEHIGYNKRNLIK